VKTPKLHFLDSGLLTTMRGYSVVRSDRNLLGSLLETFLFSELVESIAWTKERVSIFHYRDKDQVEVDFVLQNAGGQVVGIEVKAAASVTRRDFAGLERVASAAGVAFVQGPSSMKFNVHPNLLLAIKQSVDEDPRAGRFLLTGSANLRPSKQSTSLSPGRVEVVPLYPLSRSEPRVCACKQCAVAMSY
jgi:predicted AAA+ superfamily ATPase